MATIKLDKFDPREYQQKVIDDLFHNDIKRFINVWCRRAGKDLMWWNIVIAICLQKPVMILYCFPTAKQARQCIWDALTISGHKLLDMLPPEPICKINNNEMKVTFYNGSIISMASALKYDNSIVGSNCYGCIFSEAGQIENLITIYEYVRPILASNDGFVAFQSTPRGRNDFYTLWQQAQDNPKWHASLLTAYDTGHIPEEALAEERKEMSEDKFLQEYMCDFNRGQESLVFGKAIDRMRQEDRFIPVHYDPSALTHVVFDLGVKDLTAIIWFQVFYVGQDVVRINVIDYFQHSDFGLDFYAAKIQEKPYRLGTIYACHDIAVREWGNGAMPRLHMAQSMGLDMIPLDQQDKEDSVEQTLKHFPKVWIDSRNCKMLMNCLENYRREYDEEKKMYKGIVHNWASNGSDSFRYMCQAVELLKPSMPSDEFDRARREALYGNRNSFGPLVRSRRF